MESDFKRIDPAAIPDMFRKHGMRPWQGVFHCDLPGGTEGCCVNTVLVAEAIGRESAINKAKHLREYDDAECLAPDSGLDPKYAVGLAQGWDVAGCLLPGASPPEIAGYNDGWAAWKACEPLLTEARP